MAEDVYAACDCGEQGIFYIPFLNRTQLMRVAGEGEQAALAATTTEEMRSLYDARDGLVVLFEDGALRYNYETGAFDQFTELTITEVVA